MVGSAAALRRNTAPTGPRKSRIEARGRELFEWASVSRRAIEREWDAADEAFYNLGPTHVDPVQRALRESLGIQLPAPRTYAKVGLTQETVLQLIAIMCSEPLRFRIQPKGDELAQQIAAIGGQALADHWKETLWFEAEQRRMAMNIILYRVGWLGYGWNPYDGPDDPYAPGQRLGEIFMRTLDTRSVYPDPGTVDDRDMSFLWHYRRLSPGVVPLDVRKFARDTGGYDQTNRGGKSFVEIGLLNLANARYGTQLDIDQADVPIEVADLFVRPGSGLFEDVKQEVNENDDLGLHLIFVNGKIFRTLESPYMRQKTPVPMPFASARFVEDAQRRYSAGVIQGLVENDPILCDATNAMLAGIRNNRPFIAARPEMDLKNRIVNEAALIVETDDIEGLKYHANTPSTSADVTAISTLEDRIKRAAGSPDVFYGTTPVGLGGTASAVAMVKSGSELRVGDVRKGLRFAFKRAVMDCFAIAAGRYPTGRMVQVTGPSFPVRQMIIDGEGLNALSVDVFDDPMFSTNPTLRMSQVTQLAQSFGPGVMDMATLKEWLNMPQSEADLWDPDRQDQGNADEQCWLMLRGEMAEDSVLHVPGVQNDRIFIERIRMWLNSALGKQARAVRPAAYQALYADMLRRQQLLLMGMNVAAGGSPMGMPGPGPSGPSGPAGGGGGGVLTPENVGGRGADSMGQGSASSDVRSLVGHVSPATINSETGQVLANHPRVTG